MAGKSYYLEICVASSKEFTNLGRFYRFIGAGKFLIGFSYRFIGDKNFGQQNCIALFDFFSKIVYLYRFKRLWLATLAGDFGWRLWPATLALDGDFGRRLWPVTLAGDFGQRRL